MKKINKRKTKIKNKKRGIEKEKKREGEEERTFIIREIFDINSLKRFFKIDTKFSLLLRFTTN